MAGVWKHKRAKHGEMKSHGIRHIKQPTRTRVEDGMHGDERTDRTNRYSIVIDARRTKQMNEYYDLDTRCPLVPDC